MGWERGKGRAVLEAGSENTLSGTDNKKSDLLPGKGKKLLVEGRPVGLLTGGIANSSAGVIPEGLYHVFIRCLAKRAVGGHRVNHYREIPLLVCRGLVADEDNGLAWRSGIGIALGVEPDVRDPVIRDGRFIEYCTGTTDEISDILVHAERRGVREDGQRVGKLGIVATVVVYGPIGPANGRVEDGCFIEDVVFGRGRPDGCARIPVRGGDGEEKRCVLDTCREGNGGRGRCR